MQKQKVQVKAKDVLRDIRAGMSDKNIMEKYRLSEMGLASLFKKLKKQGLIRRSDVGRGKPADSPPQPPTELIKKDPWRCPACGSEFDDQFDECPQCGIVVAKYSGQHQPLGTPPPRERYEREPYSPEMDDEYEDAGTFDREGPLYDPNVVLIIGGLGALLLFFGTFMPVVKLPFVGGATLYQIGRLSQNASLLGYVFIALAVATIAILVLKQHVWLWATGIGALALLVIALLRFKQKLGQAKAGMGMMMQNPPPGMENKPGFSMVKGQMDKILDIQIGWGWLVLFLGVCLILASAFIASKQRAA